MTSTPTDRRSYEDLLAEARGLYPGIRIGRPGRARTYYPTIAALRLLRARLDIRVTGAEHLSRGPAIVLGNHVHALDPVVVVMSGWWRVSAFTKVEWFEGPVAPFFRWMGQIPLRRGDDTSTRWAMDMAAQALAAGGMIGMYPEGTRSPDPRHLHRLHKRVLVPLLQDNAGIAVHALATRYTRAPWRRIRVDVAISPPLALDPSTMDADQLTAVVRDALLELGGQTYVDRYARDVKAELAAARGEQPAARDERGEPGEVD